MLAEQTNIITTESAEAAATDKIGTRATAFGISYAITSVFSALLVVLKESNETVFNGMAALTGHHWVSHGLVDVIVFLVLGLVLARRGITMGANALIATIVGATILSGLIIAGFFV